MTHPLDNPVLASLTGPHAGLALTRGRAARYPADVSPFCALPGEPDAADWADVAGLLGPGEAVLFPALHGPPPPGWEVLGLGDGVQLVATALDAAPDEEAVPLGPADVPDMLRLTRRAKPGPFLSRTIELGAYLGIRREGQLVAMAGERMRPPGWSEISAVCTDPAWRGQGLASRLTRAVAAGIAARGETPFLHAIASNTTAIRLYTELGFTRRRDIQFPLLRRSELANRVDRQEAELRFAAELRLFLAPRHRGGRVLVACDGVSSLGHVVESLGVPLPEVGALSVNGRPAMPAGRLAAGDVAEAGAVRRPQPVPSPRFILDVHLGTLARRLRLVGVDTAYAPSDAGDDALIEQANAAGRVLLTQDRALLCRRALRLGAYVRGARPDDQLRDVLDRFAPPLAPWTRCTACNGTLAAAAKADVEPLLEPGTRRTYEAFARCRACGRVYWRGAHSQRLQRVVNAALAAVAASGSDDSGQ